MHKPRRNGKTYGDIIADVLGLGVGADRMIGGFALMTTTIMLGLLLAITAVLLTSAFNTRKVGNSFEQALSAEQIAEAGIHKAMYCLKAVVGTSCGGTFGASYTGESNVTVGTGKFTTTISGDATTKTVTSIATSATGQTKTVKSDVTKLPPTTALVLAAAVQAGAGGVNMANNVIITGDQDANNTEADSDIQSVGDVICGNNATIKGNIAVTRSGGKIDNCSITKNAYADIVTNDKVTMDAYYLTNPSGIAGSTVTGTKYPGSATPSPTPFPNLDVASWEALAAAGTVNNGNLSYGNNATATIGPEKIVGNLSTANNVVLTLTGPIWVTGTVTLGNNTVVKLSSSFGAASGVFIADGAIAVSNNSDFQGSGTTGSVIVLVSNSTNNTDGSPAIGASNNVTGAVLYAPNGEIYTSNNANVPAAIGKTVNMANNTTVNNNGLNIFNAPIYMAANVVNVNWHIGTNTWREFK